MARRKLYETKLREAHSNLHDLSTSDSYRPPSKYIPEEAYMTEDHIEDDKRDLDWATVLKRTFESYIRGERPNMYGEWLVWT